jgi:hypothetical protein
VRVFWLMGGALNLPVGRGDVSDTEDRVSDTISLDWIGVQLRVIQAEQRTLRSENDLLRTTILNSLGELVRVLRDRIGNFEALQEARTDRLDTQTESRFVQLKTRLDGIVAVLDRMSAQLARIDRAGP